MARLRFGWRLVGPGWAEARLGDERGEVACTVSYVGAGPEELLSAVTSLLLGTADTRVEFESEPTRYRWLFVRNADDVAVDVVEVPLRGSPGRAGAVRWTASVPLQVLARAVVRGFDGLAVELGDEVYEREWRHPFPRRELERLRSVWRAAGAGGRS